MLSAGKEREVGSMMTVIAPKAEVRTMGAPLDMSVAEHSSIADPLIQVLLVSIPTQRSIDLKEAGFTNIGACAHQSALSSSTSLLPFHPSDFVSHIHGFTWCSVF